MDGAASEAVRGLKAEKDSDLTQIWDALARRFGFLDEPERAMRSFDVRKQQDGESIAVFEQSLPSAKRTEVVVEDDSLRCQRRSTKRPTTTGDRLLMRQTVVRGKVHSDQSQTSADRQTAGMGKVHSLSLLRTI